jgi:ABC-type transport system involved in multi-copper enzyme maturation permease subunit
VASLFIGTLSPWEQPKILLDLAQSSIALTGALIAIFLGVSLVTKEIDRRTVYSLLSKPVARHEFLLGKFLGLAITTGVSALLMGLFAMGVIALFGNLPAWAFVQSITLLYVEMLLLTGAALLFSSYASSIVASICTVGIWVIGHLAGDIEFFGSRAESGAVRLMAKGLYYLVPNLEVLDAKANATYNSPLAASEFLLAIMYGLLYTGFLLAIAIAIFGKREFR